MRFLTVLLVGIAILLVPGRAIQARDRAQVMLVLDASGSMWQRVGTQEKILIARQVVGDILTDWDEETDLGVIAYGHRRKGDCNDIETVVPMGPVRADAIMRTVERIQPKGKTPLSAAVLKAAQELRYTEERATVILISDGKETCDRDPCAVGRELEKVGVDFTAHVIGFDIAEDEREQLQCLAEVTGGRYFAARESEELKAALIEAVAQVKAQPERVAISPARLEAPDTAPAGSTVDVVWEGSDGKNDYVAVAEPNAADNRYINYVYTSRGQPAELRLPDWEGIFELRYVSGQSKTVLARRPLQVTPVTATLTAPPEVPAGKIIEVQWAGPDNKHDYLSVAAPAEKGNKYVNYTYTSRGSPAPLQMPDEPGLYELRYVSGQSKTVLARRPLQVTPVTATLTAPPEVPAGKIIEVEWAGPDNKHDYLSVAAPAEKGNKYVNYTYTSRGSPAPLQMPDEPGLYELRYVSGQSKTVLARRPLQVTPVSASLRALAIVPTKEGIRVEWQGPDNRNDYLSVAEPSSADNKYVHYVYTNRGNPTILRMPQQPGHYELRYVLGQSKTVLNRRPIQVLPADSWSQAILEAPQGKIQLQALNAASGEPILEGLRWTVYGLQGVDQDMHSTSEAQPSFSLPAGVYRANVILNEASRSIEFIVNPGESIDRSVTFEVVP